MEKITENIFVETGFRGCNTGFVVTKEGVVMIDTPEMPGDAMMWKDEITKYGPIRYIIITEPHGDHFNGTCFFDGTIIAHDVTREAILNTSLNDITERLKRTAPDTLPLPDGFSLRPPTITLSENMTIYLGDHTFQIMKLPGHTACELGIYIPEERVAFTSDNIFYRVQTWLREALPFELLDSLKRIERLEADVLVPGHGGVCDRSYIPEISAFVQEWIDAVSSAIEQGMSLEEAQEKISFIDRYPMEGGAESMAHEVQRMNVTRLYEVLKK